MKLLEGRRSSKCISAVVPLKAASARKMDNKDDEAEEPEERERRQDPPDVGQQQTSLPSSDSKTAIEAEPIQQPHDGESSQSHRGILRDKANLRPNPDVRGNALPPGGSSPRIQIRDVSDIPVESFDSLESKRSSAVSNRPSESIEGEFELANQENMGPTLGQYRYQSTREDYEALSKSLREKTINTLIHLGEIHKAAYVDSQPPTMRAPVPPRLSEETVEAQLFLIDKELKSVARRINESKREQEYTLQLINDLEVKMFKNQGAAYIRDIMTKIPNQEDLKDMEQIRQLMLERKRLQKEIEKLKMEMSSMNKAMANADVIISDCAAIKKPRRVVICTRASNQPFGRDESSSREVIGKASSPPTATDANDLAATTGSAGSILDPEQPPEPSDVPRAPEPDGKREPENSSEEDESNGNKAL